MTSRSRGPGLLAMLAALALHAPVVRADSFVTWVAATCDARAGRAMVRFGYADSDNAPVFDRLDRSVDGGLSLRRPDNPSEYEAGCLLAPGREVKVRLDDGIGPYGEGHVQFSIWADGIRVAHGVRDDRDIRAVLTHSYLIDRRGVRECVFQLSADGDPYALTSEAGARRIPVACDVQARRIAGPRDLVEYPPGGGRPARAGVLLLAEAADPEQCRRIVVDGTPESVAIAASQRLADRFVPPPAQRVDIGALGRVLRDSDWHDIALMPDSNGVWQLKVASVEVGASGPQVRLYLLRGEVGLLDRVILLVPPTGVTDEQVRRLAESATSWDDAAAQVAARGWQAVGAAGAPLRAPALHIGTAVARDGIYLVIDGDTSDWYGDSLTAPRGLVADHAVVVRRPDGTVETRCAYRQVPRHF